MVSVFMVVVFGFDGVLRVGCLMLGLRHWQHYRWVDVAWG
jgi:hypothetical protein